MSALRAPFLANHIAKAKKSFTVELVLPDAKDICHFQKMMGVLLLTGTKAR